MGVQNLMKILREHAPLSIRQISPEQLRGKHIAIDVSVSIYQFLATTGDTESMVQGLFLRTVNLIENGIQPVYVFDGKPPEIKKETLARRDSRRLKATEQVAAATNNPDQEESTLRRNQQLMKISEDHIKFCKKLFDLMGLPYVQAPEEAEAQCVELVKSGRCFGVGTEDSDVLPLGGAILLKKLHFSKGNEHATEIKLEDVLKGLNISMPELIDLCILLGCDYCDTIKNIGHVTAFKLLTTCRSIERVVSQINRVKSPVPSGYMERVIKAREYFRNPNVIKGQDLRLRAAAPEQDKLLRYLIHSLGMSQGLAENKVKSLMKHCGLVNQRPAMTELSNGGKSFKLSSISKVLV